MSSSSAASLLDVALRPGAPPILDVGTDDPPRWAAGHRDALRATILEHGSLLIRGLPRLGRRRYAAHLRRTKSRCQPSTVSGRTSNPAHADRRR